MNRVRIKKKTKTNLIQLRDLLRDMLPTKKTELLIFAAALVFYLSYSIPILFNTCIIDNPQILNDMYLGFDNSSYFHKGADNITAHPLILIFIKPFMVIGDLLSVHVSYKSKGIFFLLCSCSLVSLSVLYVYRYLKLILKLNRLPVFIFTLFYSFTSTCIVLAFTVESFCISLFLLSFTIYFYSNKIQKNEDVGILTNAFLAIMLGGVTITNFVKGIIPILYLRRGIKHNIKKIAFVSFIFLILLLLVELKYNSFSKIIPMFLTHTAYMPNDASSVTFSFGESIFTRFFGSTMLLPEYTINRYIFMPWVPYFILGSYTHWIQYLAVTCVFLMMTMSVFFNYRQRLFQVLVLFMSVDIFLHIILRFGLYEAFIYGGHWVFLVPLFIGWLYKKLSKEKAFILIVIVSVITAIMFVNNFSWMINFWNYMTVKFPPVDTFVQ